MRFIHTFHLNFIREKKYLTAAFHYLVITTLFTILFLLFTLYADSLKAESGVMLWYAPAGLNFALLFMYGLHYSFAIVLAGFLGGSLILLPHAPLLSLILVALTTPLTQAIAVAIVRKKMPPHWHQLCFRDFMRFVIVALITPLIAGGAGLFNYICFGLIPGKRFFHALISWWIGDVIGILSITPFVMLYIAPWLSGIQDIPLTREPFFQIVRAFFTNKARMTKTD